MHWYSKIILGGLLVASMAVAAMAQSNICITGSNESGDQARAEQLRQRAAEQALRSPWDVKMFPVKNPIDIRNHSFGALCIFRVEVVLQPALKVVQVRAPKELMPAIEEAIKTVDVPTPPPPPPYAPPPLKSVEITAYVLVAAERAMEPSWMPIPQELRTVATQLKSILPTETLYLADTVVARGLHGSNITLSGSTVFVTSVEVTGGASPIVRLNNLNVQSNGGGFKTGIDIPVGTQVVVGKASSDRTPRQAVVLVITAKLLN
jgi:hypothetical protein